MPTVPTLPIGAVDQHVAQTQQATPDSFGAVQAGQIQQIGQTGMAVGTKLIDDATQQQDYANRSAVRDALSNYSEEANGYLQDNVLPKQGKDAIGQTAPTQQYLSNLQSTYNDQLANPAAQRMFGQLAPGVNTRVVRLQQRHEANETLNYHNSTLDGAIVSDTNAAVMDPENPQTTQQALSTINADTAARYPGEPDKAQQAAVVAKNNLYTGIVNRVATYNPATAMAFLANNKANILPGDYDKLNTSVLNQVKTAAAQHITSTLLAGDPAQASDQIAAISDPETQQLVSSQYKAQYTSANAQATLDSANTDAANAQAVLGADGTQGPPTFNSATTPAIQAQLLDAYNQRVQARVTNQPIQTDRKVFNSLIQQAANDPDGFLRRPLTPYLTSLSNDDFKDVMGLRADIAKGRPETAQKAMNMAGVNRVFEEGIKGVPDLTLATGFLSGKVATGPDTEAKVAQINQFRSDFMNRVKTQFPDPKDQTPDNVQPILDKMLANHVTQKGWFGGTKETTPQGLVDENPSLDRTNPAFPKPLATKFFPSIGKNLLIDYNSDQTGGKVYDKTGKYLYDWNAPK